MHSLTTHARMSFLENFIQIYVIAIVVQTTFSADYYATTHPSYSGKLVQNTVVERILIFNLTVKNSTASVPSVVHRNTLDAKCRMKCLTMDGGPCETFQTYWTVTGLFYCELLNTTLCNSCTIIASQAVGQLQSRIWENIKPDGFSPVCPCGVLPDWQVPGNCSLCGKIGFYGRNCNLRSTCASYFYQSASPVANLSAYTTSPISPCFTQGNPISTWCRGPFTFWFLSTAMSIKGFWSNTATFVASYANLITELEETRRLLGSVERNLLVATHPFSLQKEHLLFYSGFSLGPEGSLTVKRFVNMTGIMPLADGFQTPINNIPFLKPINNSCGPMWLSDPGVFNNSTHLDSCTSYSSFFATATKWAAVSVVNVVTYIDLDYFQC